MGEPGRCANTFLALTTSRLHRNMADRIIRPGQSFYVYLHRRATDGEVFYVGKGTRGRAKNPQSRNVHWQNIVAKHGFVIEYVIDGIQEWYAFEVECELIAYYGRENLCNLTDGGDGVTGMRHGPQSREAIREAHVGRKKSDLTRANMSAAQRGRVVTPEMRQLISEKLKGRPLSEETRRKMAVSRKGLKRSEATRERMRQAWADPQRKAERGAAMSAASGHARCVRCVETGEVFEQILHANVWLRQIGKITAKRSRIADSCRNKNMTAGGFHWEFADTATTQA